MTTTEAAAILGITPRIRWFVIPDGGQPIPHNANMRGRWGWDAKCECGYETRTGGATRRSVRRNLADHLLSEHGVVKVAWF